MVKTLSLVPFPKCLKETFNYLYYYVSCILKTKKKSNLLTGGKISKPQRVQDPRGPHI